MARVLFVAVLAMCLVYMLQASPMPEQNQQPNQLNQLETAVQQGLDTAKEQIHKIVNDPNVQKVIEGGAQILQDAAKAVSEKLGEFVPRTE